MNNNFNLRNAKDFLLNEEFAPSNLQEKEIESIGKEGTLDEMAKIAGDLKTAIEKVIAANGDLEGLALKKAIKGDADVQNALAGDDLYDNQLNKFIALSKGERTLGQRGRKADPNKPEAAPKSPKLKITNPSTGDKPSTKLADLMPQGDFTPGESEKGLGSKADQLAQVEKEMKSLIPAFRAAEGDEKDAITAQLKALTAQKKALTKDLFGDTEV